VVNDSVLSRFFPISSWLPKCSSKTVRADVVAGIAVAGLLVPEGMAYAGIAGVPPQIGLYAAMAGMFVYALFGTSRQLAVTSTSSSAALVAAAVAPLASPDSIRYVSLVSAAAIVAGITFLLGGVLKLGSVSEFVSKPVLKGFVFGLGLTIMVKQLHHLLGIPAGHGAFFGQLRDVIRFLFATNVITLAIGGFAIATMFLMGAYIRRVPSALVVLALGILAVRLFGLEQRGVAVVGDIQARMPSLHLPRVGTADLPELFVDVLGIVVVLTAEALAAGRTYAAKHKYNIDPNQELLAMGTANLASGLLGGMIVGGGMSGTAANDSSGARTQLSTIVAAVLVALTIGFLLPSIRQLPEAVLAAIVVHAVAHLVDVKQLRYYAQMRTGSVWVALTAICGVLLLGILRGLIVAVALTLVAVMKKLSTPQDSLLGRLPGTSKYLDIERHPEAEPIEGVLIFRPNGMLFFANAHRILSRVRQLVKQSATLNAVVMDLEASPEIDVTSLEMLEEVNEELAESGITLYFAKVPDRVVDLFSRSGFLATLGQNRICHGVDDAVQQAQLKSDSRAA
jgi:sulfate permease, SulP family